MLYEGQKKQDCCGCTACSSICPVGAIKIRSDAKGFRYPQVDQDKCIHCNKCRKVCPMEMTLVGKDADPDVYAVQNKNPDITAESSSGGMFTLLAQEIIAQGGTVYGAVFDSRFLVTHRRAQTMEQVAPMRTSKYVESDISGCFRNVAGDLSSGKPVLFTGTPCQVSSMNRYLELRRIDTSAYYTCDNICHGVPSRMVWKDYLDIMKTKYMKPEDQITGINMRSKKVSWKKQVMEIRTQDGCIKEAEEALSFNRLFLTLNLNRSSCFNCRYTSYARPADFSLGDFWNVEQAGITSFDTTKGVNEVLVNTDKGRELFEKIRDKAEVAKTDKEKAWQPHLEYSAAAPKTRTAFWEAYTSAEDKEPVLRRYIKGSALSRVIRTVSPILRKTGLYTVAGRMYRKVFVKGK